MRIRTLLILAALALLCAASSQAQVINPTRAVFTASADHTTQVAGVSQVDHYQLDVMVGSATGALAFTKDVGKPAPAPTTNEIVVTVPEFATMPNGTFVATVSAVGPGGVARSAPSAPFGKAGPPAAPTAVGVRP